MRNNKFSLATIAVGSLLTLLGPTVASARDRDDFHQNNNGRGFTNSYESRQNDRERERIRLERERFELQQKRNRLKANRFHQTRGYFDNTHRWHDYR